MVLSRDPMVQLLQAVISAPLSSTIRGLSTEVRLGPADGVRIESVADLDNVQLVAPRPPGTPRRACEARNHECYLHSLVDGCWLRLVVHEQAGYAALLISPPSVAGEGRVGV